MGTGGEGRREGGEGVEGGEGRGGEDRGGEGARARAKLGFPPSNVFNDNIQSIR